MEVKFLGCNDEQTVCDKCGKPNLKKTVILDIDGLVVRYGVDCAGRLLSRKNKFVETEASAVELSRKLLSQGHSPEVVAKAVWNKFGYCTEVKQAKNILLIWGHQRNEVPLSA